MSDDLCPKCGKNKSKAVVLTRGGAERLAARLAADFIRARPLITKEHALDLARETLLLRRPRYLLRCFAEACGYEWLDSH